ncbi:MAG: hypothetical protein HYY09_01125 [Firmicutes bacterium]|nr:hypothetical protein [Bacillota bacterium]
MPGVTTASAGMVPDVVVLMDEAPVGTLPDVAAPDVDLAAPDLDVAAPDVDLAATSSTSSATAWRSRRVGR